MRELKCRAKVKWNGNHFFAGDWVEGVYAYKELTDEHVILVERANMNKPGSYFTEVEVIPETVGQYTGLKDRNGKEIYEGDIIAFAESLDHEMYLESLDSPNEQYDELHDEQRCVTKIIYGIADDYPAFDLDEHDFEINGLSALVNYSYWYEIIGNIHENPELLEVHHE